MVDPAGSNFITTPTTSATATGIDGDGATGSPVGDALNADTGSATRDATTNSIAGSLTTPSKPSSNATVEDLRKLLAEMRDKLNLADLLKNARLSSEPNNNIGGGGGGGGGGAVAAQALLQAAQRLEEIGKKTVDEGKTKKDEATKTKEEGNKLVKEGETEKKTAETRIKTGTETEKAGETQKKAGEAQKKAAEAMPNEIQIGTDSEGNPIMMHNFMKDFMLQIAQQQIDEGQKQIDKGKKEQEEGKKDLEKAEQKIKDGQTKIKEGETNEKLADEQIKRGEEQLKQAAELKKQAQSLQSQGGGNTGGGGAPQGPQVNNALIQQIADMYSRFVVMIQEMISKVTGGGGKPPADDGHDHEHDANGNPVVTADATKPVTTTK